MTSLRSQDNNCAFIVLGTTGISVPNGASCTGVLNEMYDQRTPDCQQNVTDCIGNGVTDDRDSTI